MLHCAGICRNAQIISTMVVNLQEIFYYLVPWCDKSYQHSCSHRLLSTFTEIHEGSFFFFGKVTSWWLIVYPHGEDDLWWPHITKPTASFSKSSQVSWELVKIEEKREGMAFQKSLYSLSYGKDWGGYFISPVSFKSNHHNLFFILRYFCLLFLLLSITRMKGTCFWSCIWHCVPIQE